MNRDGNNFLSFLIGAATGIAIGMLFAPKTGEETREDLKETIDNLKYKVDDLYHRGIIKSTEIYDKSKVKASEIKDKANELKEKANEYYEKGKETTVDFINKKNKRSKEVED